MEKIYSRRRFILKPSYWYNKPNLPKLNIRKRRIIKAVIFILIILLIYKLLLSYIDPIFEALCEEKTKGIATVITNEQSTKMMNKYQYEELFLIEKDGSGKIVVIKSNVVPMNNLISDLTASIQNEFDKLEKTKVNIPVGSLTGKYFLAGMGPNIPVKLAIIGNIDTEVKSEFVNQGINQTLHRVYLSLECKMQILTPIKNYEENIVNQVIMAEHVIIGDIPDSYYNLEGMENRLDGMEVID